MRDKSAATHEPDIDRKDAGIYGTVAGTCVVLDYSWITFF